MKVARTTPLPPRNAKTKIQSQVPSTLFPEKIPSPAAPATPPVELHNQPFYSKHNMASRFFTASDSSSEESSEEELYSDEEASDEEKSEEESEEEESGEEESSSDEELGANRFLRDVSDESESDDEDQGKQLKSAKDKRFDELEGTIRKMENAEKISDWAAISTGRSPSICTRILRGVRG